MFFTIVVVERKWYRVAPLIKRKLTIVIAMEIILVSYEIPAGALGAGYLYVFTIMLLGKE